MPLAEGKSFSTFWGSWQVFILGQSLKTEQKNVVGNDDYDTEGGIVKLYKRELMQLSKIYEIYSSVVCPLKKWQCANRTDCEREPKIGRFTVKPVVN